jgi:RNA polymerase sigma-70 factor (ECF subfamily)
MDARAASVGEREFVEALRDWERTRRRLLAVARLILSNEEDAKDAVQDALVSAYHARHRFRGESLWTTWMHRIVVNTCLMKIRRRRRRGEVALQAMSERNREGALARDGRSERADAALLKREEAALVRFSIARLPEPYRTVVLLRDIGGYDTARAATALGVSTTAVKVRLHRARKALRSLLLDAPSGSSRAFESGDDSLVPPV